MTNIKEVARQAGVSASTVSRVLNAKGYVNEATRQKVLQAVQQTGYRPNVLAKSLKSGRSNTICLMVPSMQNPIFPEMARGVEDVARRSGFTVVLCNTNEDDTVEKAYIDKMKTQWIDGFVVCSSMGRADHIRALFHGPGISVKPLDDAPDTNDGRARYSPARTPPSSRTHRKAFQAKALARGVSA